MQYFKIRDHGGGATHGVIRAKTEDEGYTILRQHRYAYGDYSLKIISKKKFDGLIASGTKEKKKKPPKHRITLNDDEFKALRTIMNQATKNVQNADPTMKNLIKKIRKG